MLVSVLVPVDLLAGYGLASRLTGLLTDTG